MKLVVKFGPINEVMSWPLMREVMGLMKKGTGAFLMSVSSGQFSFFSILWGKKESGGKEDLLLATKYNSRKSIKLPSA